MSGQTFLQQFSSGYAWPSVPAKRALRFVRQVNRGHVENHRLALTLRGVVNRALDDDEGLQTSDYSTYQIFEKDDLVFKLIDLENISTSRVGIVPRRGIMSPAYIRLRPTSSAFLPRYCYWFFFSAYVNNIFNGMGGGVRQSLNPTDLLNFQVPLPDLGTQSAIVDFLDHETARIDQLIDKKQQMVETLRAKMTDYADLAATGHDSAGSLQKVDAEWLLSVPTGWRMKRAKYLFREENRPPQHNDGVITAFRDGQVCLRSRRRTEGYTFAVLEGGYQHINKGDLVIHTMDAFAGAIGVSEDDGKATGEYAVSVPVDNSVNCEYYAYLLRCMARRGYISVICPSVRERAPRFRFVRFAMVRLPVPPRDVQDQIVVRIANGTRRLKTLQTKTLGTIDRLRELRSALITGAVTGRVDVTTWRREGRTNRALDRIGEAASA